MQRDVVGLFAYSFFYRASAPGWWLPKVRRSYPSVRPHPYLLASRNALSQGTLISAKRQAQKTCPTMPSSRKAAAPLFYRRSGHVVRCRMLAQNPYRLLATNPGSPKRTMNRGPPSFVTTAGTTEAASSTSLSRTASLALRLTGFVGLQREIPAGAPLSPPLCRWEDCALPHATPVPETEPSIQPTPEFGGFQEPLSFRCIYFTGSEGRRIFALQGSFPGCGLVLRVVQLVRHAPRNPAGRWRGQRFWA